MPGVSLPNIIMKRLIVSEFIQMKMTFENVKIEMEKLLFDDSYRTKILNDYDRLKVMMGEAGCSKRAAQKMVGILSTRNSKPETQNPNPITRNSEPETRN